ncbi:hypothetical protein POV26_05980 [Aequorivita todarodis]|uniref:hypothetical protein n=1 Tax=Aequorivita todarodis TaxID=2036821 RepID=UPI002350C5EE|nr:hypothetical protein [Aequorivita todarodis]MDC8000576.1 hypothetical protein [Aequorivita todarodis]
MKNYKNIIYALCGLSFCSVVGGAIYEHLNIVPQWVKAPPASLAMLQGEYGAKLEVFWMNIHPIALLLFAITSILFWKSPRRRHILIPFAIYLLVLLITSVYFVPELMAIFETPYATTIDPSLVERAHLWESLSHIRLLFIAIAAVYLPLGLTKPEKKAAE